MTSRFGSRGRCSVCFRSISLRVDGAIRHHSGLLIRDGKFAGAAAKCSGADLPPYTGPTCSETGALCPGAGKDPRHCAHDESIVIAIAWMPPEVQR